MRFQRLLAAAGLCRAGRLRLCGLRLLWLGPTYTGPGNWAPRRVYREGSISGYGHGYNRPHHGYRVHRYGHAGRYYGQRVLRRYY